MENIRKFEPLWGTWRCEKVLGEGGFGRVYLAVRREDNHTYYSAVKHISVPANEQQLHEVRTSGYYNSEKEVSRYFEAIVRDVRAEIDLMYTLKANANIVSYEDHLIIPKPDGIGCDIFIRMEVLTPLNSVLNKNLTQMEAVKIGTDICTALEICAKAKIIHRDIKPSNIFVNSNGEYKLGDFGIARVLSGSTTGVSKKGTYSYMAPEIYKCEPANFTSDIYSLGVVLYRILNDNRMPFMPEEGMILPKHHEEAMIKMVSGVPIPPPKNASPQLAAVILKACAYNKRDRFQSAAEFKKALYDALRGEYSANVKESKYYNAAPGYESTVVSEPTMAIRGNNTVVQNNVRPAPVTAMPAKNSAGKNSTGKKIAGIIAAVFAVVFALVIAGVVLINGSQSAEEDPLGAIQDENMEPEGDVLNIYVWNEEFKGFLEKYYTVPEGLTINWIVYPSDGGEYQYRLDEALLNQEYADDDDKIDIFLAESDYIQKYVDSDCTIGIEEIGFRNADTMYQYTIDACTDSRNGVCKGISFQVCPGTLLYRRSIAADVLGTDDPYEVQEALSTWDKFDDVAAKAKKKGYRMTASYNETYRAMTNGRSSAWVNDYNELTIPKDVRDWISQSKTYIKKDYGLNVDFWDWDLKAAEMGLNGTTMCFFGPAWYYNYCMDTAHEETSGDWAVCQGPDAYFWGGTWILIADGTDNPRTIKDIFETFTTNEEVCSYLVENDAQFANNSEVMEYYANDAYYGSEFLGGQNDIAVHHEVAEKVVWKNRTQYDQLLEEGIQSCMLDYISGTMSYDGALENFYDYVGATFPEIVTD